MITSVHHVAYRCKSALSTVRFYQRYLGLEVTLTIAEDHVPSTGEPPTHAAWLYEPTNARS